jgi:hypothetical protein
MQKLLRELRREFPFAEIQHTRRGHFKLILPNRKIVIVAGSSGDPMFMRHARADIRRQSRTATIKPGETK